MTDTDVDQIDPVDQLITAWVRWEKTPGDRARVVERQEALRANGLHVIQAHHLIAAARSHGYSVPDGVQTAINQLAPQEAA